MITYYKRIFSFIVRNQRLAAVYLSNNATPSILLFLSFIYFVYYIFITNFLELNQFIIPIDYSEHSKSKRHNAWWLVASIPFLTLHAKQISDDEDKNNKGYRHKFNFIADVVETVIPSVVQIQIKSNTLFGSVPVASGSGFIVSPEGLVVTNAHVIRNTSQELSVKLQDGRSYVGRVVRIDKMADLALIKIDCVNLHFTSSCIQII